MRVAKGKQILMKAGSPNGAAFAYFLVQHKAQLGPKIITKITIIRPETDDENDFVDPSLVFQVGDAPQLVPDEHILNNRADYENSTAMTSRAGKDRIVRIHVFEA